MNKLDNYPQENHCPNCNSIDINYNDTEIDESGLTYKCECNECGFTYNECYDLVFAGIWNIQDKDGNKYEDMPT